MTEQSDKSDRSSRVMCESIASTVIDLFVDELLVEANLNDVAQLVASALQKNEPVDGVWSSEKICRAIGQELSQRDEGPGIPIRSKL